MFESIVELKMVETRQGKRKEFLTNVANNNAKKKKKVKTKEMTEESAIVTDGVMSEPINVLVEAAVAVDKEGSEPSTCAPPSASGESEEEEEEPENGEQESGKGDEDAGSDEVKEGEGVVLIKKKMMVRLMFLMRKMKVKVMSLMRRMIV